MVESEDAIDKRRTQPRQSYAHFAWFHTIEPCGGNTARGVARSCDVAENGLGFVTAHRLPPGCRLFLVVVAPEGRVAAIGTVKHCRAESKGQYRVGASVDVVPPTDLPTWLAMSRSKTP